MPLDELMNDLDVNAPMNDKFICFSSTTSVGDGSRDAPELWRKNNNRDMQIVDLVEGISAIKNSPAA